MSAEPNPQRRTRKRANTCIMPECEKPAWRSGRYPICPTHLFRIWYMIEREAINPEALDEEGMGSFYHLPSGASEFKPVTESEREVQEWARSARALQAEREKAGHVHGEIYVLDTRDGTLKIGWTKDLWKRMKQYPPTFRLLLSVAGTRIDERELHKGLRRSLIAGREWYAVTPEVVREINALIDRQNERDRAAAARMGYEARQCGPFESIEEWRGGRLLRDFLDVDEKWKERRPAPKSRSAQHRA